jgi:hypothetical protein
VHVHTQNPIHTQNQEGPRSPEVIVSHVEGVYSSVTLPPNETLSICVHLYQSSILGQGLGAALDLTDVVMDPALFWHAPEDAIMPSSRASTSVDTIVLLPEASASTSCSLHSGSPSAGTLSAGFAILRPPGHHVLPTRPMGFGLINTISILARSVIE